MVLQRGSRNVTEVSQECENYGGIEETLRCLIDISGFAATKGAYMRRRCVSGQSRNILRTKNVFFCWQNLNNDQRGC
jgi:hypothetical protein